LKTITDIRKATVQNSIKGVAISNP